jgi:hypothetical protein
LALYAAICMIAMLVLGFFHQRYSTYSAVAGAVLFPVGMTLAAECAPVRQRLLLGFLVMPSLPAGALRMTLLLGFLLVPPLAAASTPRDAALGIATGPPSCDATAAAPLLAQAAGAVVLTDPNLVPELLYRTRILTVGSLYHRNAMAYMRLRAAWRAEPGGAIPQAVQATRARFVLACKGGQRSSLVEDMPMTTLWDSLIGGNPPAWLTALAEDVHSGFVLYEVKP